MALPVNSIIEFTLRGELNSQTIMNVFHYRVQTASSLTPVSTEIIRFLDDITAGGAGAFVSNYLECSVGNYVLREQSAQAVWPTRFVRVSEIVAVSGARGNSGSANLAAVITKRTELSGRSQIGGVHIAGLTSADYADGKVTAPFKAALAAFAANVESGLTASVGGGVYFPVIWHRPPGPGTSNDVTDAFPQDTVRVMRRRTVGLGI